MRYGVVLVLLLSTALGLAQVESPGFRHRLSLVTCTDSLTFDLNRTFPNLVLNHSVSRGGAIGQPFLATAVNQPRYRSLRPGLSAGVIMLSGASDSAAWRPLHRLQSTLVVQPLSWLSVHHRFEVYSRDVSHNPWDAGWKGMYAGTRDAFLLMQLNGFQLLAGRFAPVTGPLGVNSLLFSARHSLNGYRWEYELPLGDGTGWFSAGHYQLDNSLLATGGAARRYLATHRLGYTRSQSFSVALAELFLYGGWEAVPTAATLNPFLLYHAVQMNGFEGNTLFHFSGWWRPWRGLLLTGEFLLDDLQVDSGSAADREPNEWGVAVSMRMALGAWPAIVGVDYTRIAQRTYNAPLTWQRWQVHGQPLAHPLGSDFDRVTVECEFNGWSWVQPALLAGYTRRGQRSLFADWDTPWLETEGETYHEDFPTGTIEYEWSGTLQLTAHWRRLELITRATSLAWINYQHLSGRHQDFRLEIELNLFLQTLLHRGLSPSP